MLELKPSFDVKRNVVPWLLDRGLTLPSDSDESAGFPEVLVQIVNVEKNGSILYTWKGKKGTTCIGLYDPHKKQNKLLYTFDREEHLVSCSVNLDRTLLAASVLPYRVKGLPNEFLRPVSRCLTLLIEIHPVNNIRVLKAVDTHVRVQFLHPTSDMKSFPESHLLVISEDRCIEHFHISVVIEEGYRVIIKNPDQLPKDIVVEDFLWAQWDSQGQRLFCIVEKEREAVLTCTQFYSDTNYETLLSVPLGFPLTFSRLCLVNFGFDCFRELPDSPETPKLQVFSSHTGGMSMLHSHPVRTESEFSYSATFLHHGCRKTFTVSLEVTDNPCVSEPTFINFDYYVAVYMPGHFLHLINTRFPALTCHDLFLSGKEANIKNWNVSSCPMSFSNSLLDCQSGRMYKAEIDQQFVMSTIYNSKLDCHRLGALHCTILHFQQHSQTDEQIINWLCDHISTSGSFNPIQEFILATLHRKAISELALLDKLLPYSSLLSWEGEIPGVTCRTERVLLPVFGGKIENRRGFWEEMIRNVESVRVKEGLHQPQYNNISLKLVQDRLFSELNSKDKKIANRIRNILENAKAVLSTIHTWNSDQRVVPLFQEEDRQQKMLIGLMVENLKEHLLKNLHHVGKKKIDCLVTNYVVNLLECIRQIVDTLWKKYALSAHILSLTNRDEVDSAECTVFHMMSRVLEAAKGLCLPLPPGYHTFHMVLGLRCLPLHTLLHYIDHGLLQLTEVFVTRLLKARNVGNGIGIHEFLMTKLELDKARDLDNSETNEQLKYCIVARLPEWTGEKIWHNWDHPVSSSCVARSYVEALLKRVNNQQISKAFYMRDHSPFERKFLPLTCLIKILTEVENQALNPFEEQGNVDVKFVEEIALKQTLTLLGLENL